MKQKILNSVFGLSLLITSCQKEASEPKTSFKIDNTLLYVSEPVNIQNKSDSIAVSYHWNFGDGTFSSEQNPVHLYKTPGEYTIGLTVTGESGKQSKTEQKVKVGERYVKEIVLNSFFQKKYYQNNEYWDNDSIGIQANPDLYFLLTDKNGKLLYKTNVVYNVKSTGLPLTFEIPEIKISPNLDYEIGLNCIRFYLLDQDKNSSDTIVSNLMSGISGSKFQYSKTNHSGQFDISLFANYTVKFVLK